MLLFAMEALLRWKGHMTVINSLYPIPIPQKEHMVQIHTFYLIFKGKLETLKSME